MKKLLLYIFMPILAVLLMSHNVNAISPVWDVSNYNNYRYVGNTEIECEFGGAVQTTISGYSCVISADQIHTNYIRLWNIKTQSNFEVKDGDLVSFYIFVRNNSSNEASQAKPIFSFGGHSDNNFTLLGVEQLTNQDVTSRFLANGNIRFLDDTSGENTYLELDEKVDFYSVFNVLLRVKADYNGPIYLRGSNNDTAALFLIPPAVAISPIKFTMTNFVFLRPMETKENREQKQATQDAANNSQSAGNTSTTDSQAATSSLLSVFTGFASVITNASATNCVIDAPLNTSFSNDRFNVDLCALSLPPALGALTSIIAVMVVVPFALSMFNKFIGIMESFQR